MLEIVRFDTSQVNTSAWCLSLTYRNEATIIAVGNTITRDSKRDIKSKYYSLLDMCDICHMLAVVSSGPRHYNEYTWCYFWRDTS